MASKIIDVKICDICGKTYQREHDYYASKEEANEVGDIQTCRLPAWFHNNQTDGSWHSPYIDWVSLDVCKDCMRKIIKLHANGVQGHNKFWIEGENNNAENHD